MENNENMDNLIPQDEENNNELNNFENFQDDDNLESNDNIYNTENTENTENAENTENFDSFDDDSIEDLNLEDGATQHVYEDEFVTSGIKLGSENLLTQLNNEIIAKDNKYKKIKKKNFVLTVILAVLVLIMIAIATVIFVFVDHAKLQMNILSNKFNKRNTATASEIGGLLDYELIMEKLGFIDQYVDLFFYYDKDNKKIEDSMFNGYIKALGDKYAEYMPAKQYDNFIEETSGEYYGIGCQVKTDPETNDHVVEEVFEGSPAEKAGVLKGDIIRVVGGVDVKDKNLQEVVDLVKGEEGTEVVIGFYRPSEKKIIDLTCVRGKVEVKRVDYEILEDNIGYIEIKEFTGKTEQQFKNTIDALIEKESKGLVIDLRNNPGGELMTVLNMLDYVLKDNDGKYTLNRDEFKPGNTLLVYMRDKESIVDSYYCDDQHEVTLPIVILINENSASASELFTQCLKDYQMAKVVGHKSYGKGVMQNVQPLPDGSAIRLTVAGYFPPSGYEIDGHGVVPDIGIDVNGDELFYDKDGNEFYFDYNKKVTILANGEEKVEILASVSETTKSNATKKKTATSSEVELDKVEKSIKDYKPHNELAIYDDKFKYQNENWYIKLEEKYDDKELLQALVLLK